MYKSCLSLLYICYIIPSTHAILGSLSHNSSSLPYNNHTWTHPFKYFRRWLEIFNDPQRCQYFLLWLWLLLRWTIYSPFIHFWPSSEIMMIEHIRPNIDCGRFSRESLPRVQALYSHWTCKLERIGPIPYLSQLKWTEFLTTVKLLEWIRILAQLLRLMA